MVTAFKFICIVMGFAFPAFLMKAIRAKPEEEEIISKYTASACCSFGIIVFTIMGLL